jgi:hypothetical protein
MQGAASFATHVITERKTFDGSSLYLPRATVAVLRIKDVMVQRGSDQKGWPMGVRVVAISLTSSRLISPRKQQGRQGGRYDYSRNKQSLGRGEAPRTGTQDVLHQHDEVAVQPLRDVHLAQRLCPFVRPESGRNASFGCGRSLQSPRTSAWVCSRSRRTLEPRIWWSARRVRVPGLTKLGPTDNRLSRLDELARL